MPNTIRTESELLSLFIDNNQGLINAQDMRDFVVSSRIGHHHSGPRGHQGSSGSNGVQGSQGRIGPQGAQGEQSTVQGPSGLQGNQGFGFQGDIGSQGFQGSDVSVLYTNASSTPSTIGGIPSGSTFASQTMQQMWNSLLYPYQSPDFSSFVMSGQSTSVEVGVTVSGTRTFTWGTTNSGNVSSNTILIRDVTNNVDLVSGSANDGTQIIVLPASIQKTNQASHQWSIIGTNTNAGNFSSTFTVSWLWRRYFGPSTNSTLTEVDIEALASSGLASIFSGTFSYAGGGYKFLSFPTSFGSPASFKDADTNLNVAMASSVDDAFFSNTANSLSYGLVSFTNSFSQTTNYRVYRTKNILGGAISIIVS